MAQIIWSDEALLQLYDTLEFWEIRNQSSKYSEKIAKNVVRTEINICNHPKMGTGTDFPNVYRVRLLNYFSIFYEIHENYFEILTFWDGRRNPENLDF